MTALLSALLLGAGSRGMALGLSSLGGPHGLMAPALSTVPGSLPIQQQPFYGALLQSAERWQNAPLGQVVGESPRDTLLNFYAVMARVDGEVQALIRRHRRIPAGGGARRRNSESPEPRPCSPWRWKPWMPAAFPKASAMTQPRRRRSS